MRGILGNFHNYISGDASRGITKLDLFGKGTVGGGWKDYLTDLYATDTRDSHNFKSQAGALQDYLGQEANASGEQLSQASSAGGFYDSGARLSGLNDINRSKLASYSQGLASILASLEHEKMTAAFPFLQMQQENWNQYYAAIAKTQDEQNFRGAALGSSISSVFGGGGFDFGSAGGFVSGQDETSGGYPSGEGTLGL